MALGTLEQIARTPGVLRSKGNAVGPIWISYWICRCADMANTQHTHGALFHQNQYPNRDLRELAFKVDRSTFRCYVPFDGAMAQPAFLTAKQWPPNATCENVRLVEVPMEISHEDFVMFIDRALDGMLRIVEELGDERANMRPDLPGANSPYAILTHCIGVCDYWIGALLGKRELFRDRDAEFRACGTVVELRERVGELKAKLLADMKQVQGGKPLASAPNSMYNPLRGTGFGDWTEGTALIHAYEELAQHHGQMELTRDVLTESL